MNLTGDSTSIYKIKQHLPQKITACLSRLDKVTLDKITEIRLRSVGASTITLDNKNLVLCLDGISQNFDKAIKLNDNDIEEFLYKFCNGSVYSYENTLKDFYVSSSAVRVGLSGEAIYKNGVLSGIGKITGANIRLPRHIKNISEKAYRLLQNNGLESGKGLLVVSKPGIGKTTFLRDLAVRLSSIRSTHPRRVCVIDERNEIYIERLFDECCCDFLSGTDKIKGLETALRVLSPEIVICDEISGPDEADKIIRYTNRGIIFIASAHAASFDDALSKTHIRNMLSDGVFSHIILLERNEGCFDVSAKDFTNDN